MFYFESRFLYDKTTMIPHEPGKFVYCGILLGRKKKKKKKKKKKMGSHKSYLPCAKWRKIYQVYLVPNQSPL